MRIASNARPLRAPLWLNVVTKEQLLRVAYRRVGTFGAGVISIWGLH
jgi:hypothetical protein